MTDIVERLEASESLEYCDHVRLCDEAAAEIRRLREAVANMTETIMNAEQEHGHRQLLALECERLREVLLAVMFGGNHLANVLAEKLGASFPYEFPPDTETESALRRLGATPEFDVWCAWRSIMLARTALAPVDSGQKETPEP